MKASTTILHFREAAARCLGGFTTLLCLASVPSTHLLSAENGIRTGSFDPSFAAGLNGWVDAIVVQPDGRLLVGGEFHGSNLVGFTRDGAPDSTFTPTSLVSWQVTHLALQPDGKVLAGNKGGVDGAYPAIGLVRFLPDGSNDPGFQFRLPTNSLNNGIWSGFWTTALTVQPDGKILLAGHYERDHFDYWYWSAVSLQRLLPDGSQGEFFRLGWPTPQYIGVLVLLPDQRILVAGDQLARLNGDGTEDAGFLRTTLSTGRIACCVTQADGKILIGGSFTNVQGHPRCRVARILPDGQLDLSFNPPGSTRVDHPNPHDTAVRALAVQADGRILVGGTFDTMDGLPYAAFARLNCDGSLDTSFPPSVRREDDADYVTVGAIVIQDGDRAFIGGANLVTSQGLDAGDLFRIHLGEVSPRLSILHVPSGTIHLNFHNPGGHDFTVLGSTNLGLPPGDWTVLGPATHISGDLYRFTDQRPPSAAPCFYRLLRLAPR